MSGGGGAAAAGGGGEAEYEALPQRAPKAKRKRVAEAPERAEAEEAPPEAAAAAPGAAAADPPAGNPPAVPLEMLEYRADAVPGQKFEYLDHTADVQLHAWGADLREAFQNVGLAMFNYMTPLDGIEEVETRTYTATGRDLHALLYHWLDELLFGFATELFVPRRLCLTRFDRAGGALEAEGVGERFDRARHSAGTEVKAITYSAMQVNEAAGDAEVFVIVDI